MTMRASLLAAVGCASPFVAGIPTAQAQQLTSRPNASLTTVVPGQSGFDMRPIVVGLGAIAGVVAFNVLFLGVGALPGGFAYGVGASVPAEMSVAMNRVYATSSAVAGALVGAYAAGPDSARDGSSVSRQLLAAGAGAVSGVVAFNILSAPLGTVPLAGGALDVVSYEVVLGSRLLAATTIAGGALAANWLYDRWTGTQSNYRYLGSLAVGALAGVAVGNYLTAGTFGTPPYYVGAGVANAAGALAGSAAQAASRVYVVGSAALGAWAADYLYRR